VAEAGELAPILRGWRSAARLDASRMPSSDVDSAIVWFGEPREDEIRPYLHAVATKVVREG